MFMLKYGVHVPKDQRAAFQRDIVNLVSWSMSRGRDDLVEAFKRLGEDVAKGGGTGS